MNKYKNKYAQKLEDKAREKFGKQKGLEEESGVSSDEPSDDTSNQDNTSSPKAKPRTRTGSGNMRKWLMGLLAMVLIASLVFNVMSWQQAQQTNDKLVKMDKKVQNTENGIVNVYREVEGVTGEGNENGGNDTSDDKSTEDKLNDISTKVDSLKAKYESFAKEQREQNEDMQEKLDNEE